MHTKEALVRSSTRSGLVRQMYEMYMTWGCCMTLPAADGGRSRRDHGRPLSRGSWSVILRNPIYVIDPSLRDEFYKARGRIFHNDKPADFAGQNGCHISGGGIETRSAPARTDAVVPPIMIGIYPNCLGRRKRRRSRLSATFHRRARQQGKPERRWW